MDRLAEGTAVQISYEEIFQENFRERESQKQIPHYTLRACPYSDGSSLYYPPFQSNFETKSFCQDAMVRRLNRVLRG